MTVTAYNCGIGPLRRRLHTMEGPPLGSCVVAAIVPGQAVPELSLEIITFIEPWGSRSWIARISVKYNNPRQSHVQLRRKPGAPMPNAQGLEERVQAEVFGHPARQGQ